MPRQSITLTKPNEEWLLSQVDNDEYSSKSELINDLIRKARRAEAINQKLERAEQSGFTEQTAAEILAEAKASVISR
ncbi:MULTISPECIES: ribbon-helix-helix domain-containing protein [Thalassomonas]|uniref:CopG family transcriptional regulator n=1 Tax=Thalassomonas actiniarum TaxID=485447 RepID=A0AAE9YM85_9GAMM|nr:MULTISPECIES: CopG family transcriptional regulator [Thalassomonas]WDD97168.1 CopG family transcriptional regulator [Thalassomonas actiniarum]